jgi:hypothetical protein
MISISKSQLSVVRRLKYGCLAMYLTCSFRSTEPKACLVAYSTEAPPSSSQNPGDSHRASSRHPRISLSSLRKRFPCPGWSKNRCWQCGHVFCEEKNRRHLISRATNHPWQPLYGESAPNRLRPADDILPLRFNYSLDLHINHHRRRPQRA